MEALTDYVLFNENLVGPSNEAKKCVIAAELNKRLKEKNQINTVANNSEEIQYLRQLRGETLPIMYANLVRGYKTVRELIHYICVAHLLETCLDIIFVLDEPFSDKFLLDLQLRINYLHEQLECPPIEYDCGKTGIDNCTHDIRLKIKPENDSIVCIKTEPGLDGADNCRGVQASAEQAECPAELIRPEVRPFFFPGRDNQNVLPLFVEMQNAKYNNVAIVNGETLTKLENQLQATASIQPVVSAVKASHPILHDVLTSSDLTTINSLATSQSQSSNISYEDSNMSKRDKRCRKNEKTSHAAAKLSRRETSHGAPLLPLSVEKLNNDCSNEMSCASSSSGMRFRSRSPHVKPDARFQLSHLPGAMNTFDPGLCSVNHHLAHVGGGVGGKEQGMAGESSGQQEGHEQCCKQDARIPESVANETVD